MIIRKKQAFERKRPLSYQSGKAYQLSSAESGTRKRGAGVSEVSGTKLWARLTLAGFVLIVVILVGASTSVDIDNASIVTSGDTQPTLQDMDVYRRDVSMVLHDRLSSRSKLTIDTASVVQQLQDTHPELSGVSVQFTLLGRRPIVRLQAAVGVLKLQSKQQQVILDSNGRVIKVLNGAAEIIGNLPMVIDESGLNSTEPGSQYITPKEVSFLLNIFSISTAANREIESVSLPSVAQEAHVRYKSIPNVYIKFSSSADLQVQMGSMMAIEKHLQQEGKRVGEYIDVRVEGKVFYK